MQIYHLLILLVWLVDVYKIFVQIIILLWAVNLNKQINW